MDRHVLRHGEIPVSGNQARRLREVKAINEGRELAYLERARMKRVKAAQKKIKEEKKLLACLMKILEESKAANEAQASEQE